MCFGFLLLDFWLVWTSFYWICGITFRYRCQHCHRSRFFNDNPNLKRKKSKKKQKKKKTAKLQHPSMSHKLSLRFSLWHFILLHFSVESRYFLNICLSPQFSIFLSFVDSVACIPFVFPFCCCCFVLHGAHILPSTIVIVFVYFLWERKFFISLVLFFLSFFLLLLYVFVSSTMRTTSVCTMSRKIWSTTIIKNKRKTVEQTK